MASCVLLWKYKGSLYIVANIYSKGFGIYKENPYNTIYKFTSKWSLKQIAKIEAFFAKLSWRQYTMKMFLVDVITL